MVLLFCMSSQGVELHEIISKCSSVLHVISSVELHEIISKCFQVMERTHFCDGQRNSQMDRCTDSGKKQSGETYDYLQILLLKMSYVSS